LKGMSADPVLQNSAGDRREREMNLEAQPVEKMNPSMPGSSRGNLSGGRQTHQLLDLGREEVTKGKGPA